MKSALRALVIASQEGVCDACISPLFLAVSAVFVDTTFYRGSASKHCRQGQTAVPALLSLPSGCVSNHGLTVQYRS